ncbi:unnamed protein product [Gulo gulo]|uniref:Uncharacterized protein n=1 Tax=Gulo gulo TaxID=48420 RepID=A0A9X9LDH5_GULGU|nr:unnamed protein product [Gulo gulo]
MDSISRVLTPIVPAPMEFPQWTQWLFHGYSQGQHWTSQSLQGVLPCHLMWLRYHEQL